MPHGMVNLSGAYSWHPSSDHSSGSSSASSSSSSSSEDEAGDDERAWPIATDEDTKIFTYVPRRDAPSPPPSKRPSNTPVSYFSYEPGSAGRMTAAAPPVVVYPPTVPVSPLPKAYNAEQAPVHTYCHHHSSASTPVVPIFAHCGHQASHLCSGCAHQEDKKPPATPKGCPSHPNIAWLGSTKKEVDAQNAAIHDAQRRAVPFEYTPDLQYWVKELDGTYTLRTHSDIGKNCLPGEWKQTDEGWWYWVRKEEPKKEKKKTTKIVQWKVDDWPRAFFI